MNGNPHRVRSHARPAHPPFTDFPLAAYVFAAGFDIASVIGGSQHRWSQELWHAGTFVLVAGLSICLITMGTGFWDLVRFPPRSPEAVRTIATHVGLMAGVFMIGAADLAWRLSDYGSVTSAPLGVAALSLIVAVIACTGAFFGGKLVFGHGIGVPVEALAAHNYLLDNPTADDHGQAGGEQATGDQATDGQVASAPALQPPRPDTLT
jgi:uncharacterized membrane protein